MNINKTQCPISTCEFTKMYSLYHHSYSKYLFHIIKQLLTFNEVNTGLY